MAEKNYYEILGVKKDATDADIKKRYRKLVREYHPDVSKDPDADSKIAVINNAYETIRDKDKRAEYDAMLNNPFAGQGGGFGGQSGAGQPGGFRWDDMKGQFGEGQAFGEGSFRFDDIFSAFGHGARGQTGGSSAAALISSVRALVAKIAKAKTNMRRSMLTWLQFIMVTTIVLN